MQALAYKTEMMDSDLSEKTTINITLYDLIEAISEEIEPGENELIVPVVLDLIESGRVKRKRNNRNC
jgi:hypothetical protein